MLASGDPDRWDGRRQVIESRVGGSDFDAWSQLVTAGGHGRSRMPAHRQAVCGRNVTGIVTPPKPPSRSDEIALRSKPVARLPPGWVNSQNEDHGRRGCARSGPPQHIPCKIGTIGWQYPSRRGDGQRQRDRMCRSSADAGDPAATRPWGAVGDPSGRTARRSPPHAIEGLSPVAGSTLAGCCLDNRRSIYCVISQSDRIDLLPTRRPSGECPEPLSAW
jgi:hypothetical protein